MKNLPLALLLFISSIVLAQSPESFKYQALVRDASGHIITNKNISIRISILQSSIDGESVYTETHTATTNNFGSINLEIGKGNNATGLFNEIDWGGNTHFVKIEMDIDADNVFEDLGTTQLLSVPYALYAKKSGDEKWVSNGNDITYNKGKVGIGLETPLETLHINGNIRGAQLGGALRVNTDFGYLDVGAKNADYAHFYTNMPYGFYFGNTITVRDQLIGYKEGDLHLSTQSQYNYQPEKRLSILNSNGYVGIGNTNPAYNLDVNGAVNASSFLINGVPFIPDTSVWSLSGNDTYYLAGKVGIGVSNPLETLHINGNIRGAQSGGALRVNTDFGYLDVGAKNADYAHFYTNMPYGFYFGGLVTVREQLIGYKEGDLHLSTQSKDTFQPEKRISILNSNGYVGIGKTNPAYNLDVNGTINASSVLINGTPIIPSTSVWSLSGNNAYYSAGKVGIGVSNPLETLHINGSIRGAQLGGALRVNTDFGYLDVGAVNADYAHFYTNVSGGFYFGGTVTVREQLIGYRSSDLHLSTLSTTTYQPEKRVSILNSNGYVGIGTTQPKSQLQIEKGDIYLQDASAGVIMKSPDQQCWKLTVSNAGAPVFVSVPCPQ